MAAIMAVALVVVAACMIRLGYKALLAEWAIEAITKAEKKFVGTSWAKPVWRLSSWLRAKVPAPCAFGYGQHDSESGADDLLMQPRQGWRC